MVVVVVAETPRVPARVATSALFDSGTGMVIPCRGIVATSGMVKLTCLLRRKAGMSPEQFHTYWRERHGPLVAATRSGSHVIRYEQHHRPLSDYPTEGAVADATRSEGYDGVTEQWFASMDEYRAHIAEEDFTDVWADLQNFLDTDRLEFVLTEEGETVVVVEGPRT